MRLNNKDNLLNLLLVTGSILLGLVIVLAAYAYRSTHLSISDLSPDERMHLLSLADRISPEGYQKFPPSGEMLFYHLAPDTKYENTFGTSFATNELGFRSPAVADIDARNVKQLLLVGDSWTFGPGVSDKETFGQQLQALLDNGEEKWEVHNLSMIGWNTDNEINALRTWLAVLQPDIVVICPTSNDIDDSLAVWRGRLVNDGFESHALFRYSYEYEQRWTEVFRKLDREVSYLNGLGIPTLIYFLAEWRKLAPYYASKSGLKAPYTVVPTDYIHSRYRLETALDPGRHANSEGHRLLGTYLYNALIEAGLLTTKTPAPLDTAVSFPGKSYNEDIETDFGFWWKHAQARDLIPMEGDFMARRGFFSVAANTTASELRVSFRLLDLQGLYPLQVTARLAAPGATVSEQSFEHFVGGVHEFRLPKPAALDPYPIIEVELTCSRVANSKDRFSPLCLKLDKLTMQ